MAKIMNSVSTKLLKLVRTFTLTVEMRDGQGC